MDDTGGVGEQQLVGGVANVGKVVRVGEHLLRPSNPYSRSIHQYLIALREAGFDGASVPVGIDEDGRERLLFIDGDVPVPTYPRWAQSDAALVSITSGVCASTAETRPGVRSGKPCFVGTRMAAGMTTEEIVADFPGLSPEHVRAALEFAALRERRLATA